MDNTDWDKMSEEKFYEFNKRWMSEVYRILKPTGTMWMFCGPTKIPEIFKVVEEVGFINHLDDWTIYARAKGRKSKTGLKSLREDILHLTKSDEYTWHSCEYLREVVVPYVVDGKPRGWALDQSTGLRVRWTGVGNVAFFTPPAYNNVAEKQIHSCQKPVLLNTELIMYSSNKGDTVIDPFMGSGSSAVASLISDRNYIGCEKEKDMFKEAKKWIDSAEDPATRVYSTLEEYVKSRISTDEKNSKFGFGLRRIMPK
jgi:site-specific DNA-methyltransferase (adenine-specific)